MSGLTSWMAPRSTIAERAYEVGRIAVCTATRPNFRFSFAIAAEDGLTVSPPNASKPVTSAFITVILQPHTKKRALLRAPSPYRFRLAKATCWRRPRRDAPSHPPDARDIRRCRG